MNSISRRAIESIKNFPLLSSFWVQKRIALLRRYLAMHGVNPFMGENPVSYWRSQTLRSTHNPLNYLIPDELTDILFMDLIPRLGKEASFMEIGCSAGRNLHFLHELGYRNLAGIEINRLAVEDVLRKKYPRLYEDCNFLIGNAAEEIRKIQDASFDVVFSKGVLIHIPPSQRSLFRNMVRICKKYIVIYTSEVGAPFPYDFEKIFTRLGCKTILYRSFYGGKDDFAFPIEPYDQKKHYFQETFLRVFVKTSAA